MQYRYYICDVFTKKPFCGNQLAVFPEAEGLCAKQMQKIAKEFNFSETSFVFPSKKGYTKKVRIFTPTREVPFAGHPNIGTAFVLANDGSFGTLDHPKQVTFEEEAGVVSVSVTSYEDCGIFCELSAPQNLSVGNSISTDIVASVLSLNEADILTQTHRPQIASVGLPFLFVEVLSLEVLQRAEVDISKLRLLSNNCATSYIHVYCRNINNYDLQARMFAPLDGVTEDPATGSANSALVGLLALNDLADDSETDWYISQGTEIGRPSTLYGRTRKEKGKVTGIWMGGYSTLNSEGIFYV